VAKDHFYWRHIVKDITYFVRNACKYLKDRRPNIKREAIQSAYPFEVISMDDVHLERSKGGYVYILVLVDHFTRFAQEYPTRNKSATTAAHQLFNDFIPSFGFPNRILHDQGREF
jgi:hypothetical protein